MAAGDAAARDGRPHAARVGRDGSRRPLEIEPGLLRRTCDPAAFEFASTAEVEPLEGTIGQDRADEAISFGLDVETSGYNVFATGPIGTGKRTALESHLGRHARARPSASDWVYLHNFPDPRRPIAIALPSGRGRELAAAMSRLLEDAQLELTRAFESDTYARRRRETTEALERERDEAFAELRDCARRRQIGVELTPAGVMSVPLHEGRPLSPDDFQRLPTRAKADLERGMKEVEPRVGKFVTLLRALEREGRERLRALEREVGLFAVGHLIDEIRGRYADVPRLGEWLDAALDDMTENMGPLARSADGDVPPPLARGGSEEALGRYEVNVFVSNEPDAGAPVVVETTPTYPNLFGRVEHQGVFGGAFMTDHRMLQPGAVHRANGGYLMLPAADVLAQPLAWLKLKDVLRTGRIRLENPADQYALIPMRTLTPEEIDLDVKVVLVGAPPLYELAYRLDEDVRKLFRVKAEFDWRMAWDDAGLRAYAGFLSSQARSSGLRQFDPGAVARVVEHGARIAGQRDWLTTRFVEIAGLAAEASHWAAHTGSELVRAEHVERAIERKLYRSSLLEQRLLDMVAEGTLMIDVDGERIGQVNGLSVLDLGDYAFGRPVRITATTGVGRGDVASIDRDTKLSGPIHNKGFLILRGYLYERYGAERRIALAANVAFEQSYEEIEGDSAASAELYALLSELAGLPLRQDIAVTGSVNQHGELQAIGGVNEKIEGFHRACSLAGLTGRQGVLIPQANTGDLMLSAEVVDSVRAGRFHVWSAADADAGIELLTGIPAGRRRADGKYPEGTVHARVEERLKLLAEVARADDERRVESGR
jgi:predicted ATP-dependent protease